MKKYSLPIIIIIILCTITAGIIYNNLKNNTDIHDVETVKSDDSSESEDEEISEEISEVTSEIDSSESSMAEVSYASEISIYGEPEPSEVSEEESQSPEIPENTIILNSEKKFDSEMDALKEYERTMPKACVNQPDIPYDWVANHYRIDDFNNDGHPELIIQYICYGSIEAVGNSCAGLAIELVEYRNNKFNIYKTIDPIESYTINAGQGPWHHNELRKVDQIFIDDNNNFGILHWYAQAGKSVVLHYFTLEDNDYKKQYSFSAGNFDLTTYKTEADILESGYNLFYAYTDSYSKKTHLNGISFTAYYNDNNDKQFLDKYEASDFLHNIDSLNVLKEFDTVETDHYHDLTKSMYIHYRDVLLPESFTKEEAVEKLKELQEDE